MTTPSPTSALAPVPMAVSPAEPPAEPSAETSGEQVPGPAEQFDRLLAVLTRAVDPQDPLGPTTGPGPDGTDTNGAAGEALLDVADRALASVETLLDAHRLLIRDQLVAEADRFTKGAFADGIRHAAAVAAAPSAIIAPDPDALGVVDTLVENLPALGDPAGS